MKIVINENYGGFMIPERWREILNVRSKYPYQSELDRSNPTLVELVENNPSENSDLVVVQIPDEATDYLITDYDGCETVYYVLNGKIHSITPAYDDED